MKIKLLAFTLFSAILTPTTFAWSSGVDILSDLHRSEFAKLHLTIVEINTLREKRSLLPLKKIPEGSLSTTSSYQKLIDLLFLDQAHAEAREGTCIFGGWASFTVGGKCRAPWNYSSDYELKSIGPTYSSDFFCGSDNLFRCNPILFGPGGQDGKGHCIELENGGYENLSLNCFKKSKETPEDLYDLYRNDPNFRMAYLNLIEETMGFCSQASDYDACRVLVSAIQSSKNFVCNDQTLNQLLGSERFMELENIWGSVEGELIQNQGRAKALGERVTSYVEQHPLEPLAESSENYRSVSGTDFDNYSNSPQVQKMIATLKKNTQLNCGQSLGSCHRPTAESKPRDSSEVGQSISMCWRYVKLGLMGGDLSKNYIGGEFAVHAGRSLKQKGFVNLLDSPEYRNMTPHTAPPGAVLVYRKEGSYTPGHIEVKTDTGTFISDFESKSPITDYNPRRHLIGIYINPNAGGE